MTVTTERPGPVFRIDMLWNDSRYRSTFLQIIALIVVMLSVLWLVNNVVENLAALGKEFSFSFMDTPSSYDINQRLIEYTSRSTHSTAAVVGMLNTLLIAVMGCTLATLIGVLAGVLRLSKNWIVARLMTVYIEGVRNVPVLIQILLYAAVFDEVLPAPSAFRGEVPEATMLFGTIAATNRGFYFPMPIFGDGSFWVVLGFIAAICAAVWFNRFATKRQQATGEHLPVLWINLGIIVGVTLLVFLVMGQPITLEYPELAGFNFKGGLYARNSLVALWLALSVYTGAFIAENVRAGIMAVAKGQTEAAFALGMRPNWTMRLIILPQALRVIIPPLISQYLNLTKNSSLAIAVGYMDVTGTLGGITLNQTGKEMETIMLLMVFYLTISLSISFVMNLYNEQVKLVERTSVTGGGFSVLNFMGSTAGKWEILKRGDAKMHDNYGVAGWLNLVVLLYGTTFVLMLYYVFIDPVRESYWEWGTAHQMVALAVMLLSGATMVTCIFKSARFIDLAVFELILFVVAVLIGLPVSEIAWGASATIVVFGGLAARLATIAYTIFAPRPNITFFNRIKVEVAS